MTQEVRLRYWAEIMRECKESGVTIRKWCKDNNIVEKTYYYWQRRLREAACEQLSEIQSTTNQSNLCKPSFAEVRIIPPSLPMIPLESAQSSQIQFEVRGIKITADGAYPENKLIYLLRELVSSC